MGQGLLMGEYLLKEVVGEFGGVRSSVQQHNDLCIQWVCSQIAVFSVQQEQFAVKPTVVAFSKTVWEKHYKHPIQVCLGFF